jgi:hypothetical protein
MARSGKTRRSLFVTVISGVGALGFLLFDLLAHQQFSTFFRLPLGIPVAVAILVLFIYCAAVILQSLLTTERVFINEIIGQFYVAVVVAYLVSMYIIPIVLPFGRARVVL